MILDYALQIQITVVEGSRETAVVTNVVLADVDAAEILRGLVSIHLEVETPALSPLGYACSIMPRMIMTLQSWSALASL